MITVAALPQFPDSFFGVPSLNGDPIECDSRSGPVCAMLAMDENGLQVRIVDDIENFLIMVLQGF